MTPSQHKLDGISIIRTFAAVAIMLYHIGFGHYYLTQINFASGVHLFFCISAFLIMYTTERKKASEFLKKRLIRIIPLYFILTIFTFAASKLVAGFGQDNIGLPELIKSLLFIPYSRSGLKSDFAVRPIVGPAWTLYFDIWFAFIFFVSMKIKHKDRGLIAAALCIASYILGHMLPDSIPPAVLLQTGYMLSFVAGILVYYIWNFVLSHKSTSFSFLWGILAGILMIYFYFAPEKLFLKIILSSAILLLALISTHQKPVPKIFTYFSQISFSFYLLHYYVILITGKVIDYSTLNIKTILGTLGVFVLTLFVSLCSYIVIEKNIFTFFKTHNDKTLKGLLEYCFK